MAKHLYLLVFFDDNIEHPIDAMGDWLVSLPSEHSGQDFGIDHMVMAEIPLTEQDAANYTMEDEYVDVFVNTQRNGYE